MSIFGKARVLASLSDRQQAIIAGVAPISKTLAEWIAGQFVAGRTPDEVWKMMEAARQVDTAGGATFSGKWFAKLAYNGARVNKHDTIRHRTLGPVLFESITSDGMLVIIRPDTTKGEFLPLSFDGIEVEREQ